MFLQPSPVVFKLWGGDAPALRDGAPCSGAPALLRLCWRQGKHMFCMTNEWLLWPSEGLGSSQTPLHLQNASGCDHKPLLGFIWKLGSRSWSEAFWRSREAHRGPHSPYPLDSQHNPSYVAQNVCFSQHQCNRESAAVAPPPLHPRANAYRLSNSPWEFENLRPNLNISIPWLWTS